MSGARLEDMWLWDDRGEQASLQGRLKGYELKEYLQIQGMRKVAFCAVCGEPAHIRYAPNDGGTHTECSRWRCEEHRPADATDEYWNGEWTAETMEDAKQMAVDFNEGVS